MGQPGVWDSSTQLMLPCAQVDPEDLVMLVIAWHFGAATMCEFSRAEFARGMRALRCDSPRSCAGSCPSCGASCRTSASSRCALLDCHAAVSQNECRQTEAWSRNCVGLALRVQDLCSAWWVTSCTPSLYFVGIAWLWLYCPVTCVSLQYFKENGSYPSQGTCRTVCWPAMAVQPCSSHTSVGVAVQEVYIFAYGLAWRRA